MTDLPLEKRRQRLMRTNLLPALPRHVTMDEVIATSFKNFHVKGFDYICLKRSDAETLKIYVFDGDCAKLPTLIAPHDHRYDFKTTVIAGAVDNLLFQQHANGEPFQRFHYRTPLNGGDGFEWFGEARLLQAARRTYREGQSYVLFAEEIHTIAIRQPQTMLFVHQFEDVQPAGEPTATFMPGTVPPATDDGLYERFTPDEVRARFALLCRLTGFDLEAV